MTGLIQDTRVVVIAVIAARPKDHKQTPNTPLHICGIHISSSEGIIVSAESRTKVMIHDHFAR